MFVSDVEKETLLKNLEINIGFKNILTCKWLVFQNCELKYITIILFQSYFFFPQEGRNSKTLLATNIFDKVLDYISIFKKQSLKHQIKSWNLHASPFNKIMTHFSKNMLF